MECLGVEPGAAWWKAQTNSLCYGGTPNAYSELTLAYLDDQIQSIQLIPVQLTKVF